MNTRRKPIRLASAVGFLVLLLAGVLIALALPGQTQADETEPCFIEVEIFNFNDDTAPDEYVTVEVTSGESSASVTAENDGIARIEVHPGDTIKMIAAPDAPPDGESVHAFVGWELNGIQVSKDDQYTFTFSGSGTVRYRAVFTAWNQRHSVNFHTNGGTPDVPTQYVLDGENIDTSFISSLAKENRYGISAWYADENFSSYFSIETTPVTQDLELYARWKVITNLYACDASNGYASKQTDPSLESFGGLIIPAGGIGTSNMWTVEYSEKFDATFTAEPDTDRLFKYWCASNDTLDPNNLNIISYDATRNFIVNVDDTDVYPNYYAVFGYPTITYDANGGTATSTSPTKHDLTAASATFGGNGHKVVDDFGDDFTPPENHRLIGIEITDQATGDVQTFYFDEEYSFTVTHDTVIKYLWKTYPVTFHFSSIDGDDLVEPIILYADNPYTSTDALIEKYYGHFSTIRDITFSVDGYIDSGLRLEDSASSYASMTEAEENQFISDGMIGDNGRNIYILMLKKIKDVSIGIKAPDCGTKIEAQQDDSGWMWNTQTNPPDVTTPPGALYALATTDTYLSRFWIADTTSKNLFVGTITGDEQYFALTWVKATYGYGFGWDVSASVSGGTLENTGYVSDKWWLGVIASVKAEHVAGDAAEENQIEPKCFEDGSYDMVTRCTGCDTILDSEHVSIPKVGLHDWGEWTTTTEPTTTTEGVSTRVCKRCGLEETKAIDKKPANDTNAEEKTDNTEQTDEAVPLVSTGDVLPVVLIVSLVIAAAIAAIAAFIVRRKR